MSLMRITIIHETGTVSFGAEPHVAKMILHAAAKNVRTIEQVIEVLPSLDPDAAASLRAGIARFDEFVVPGDSASIQAWVTAHAPDNPEPFRLLDPAMREATLTPLGYGIVVFNLIDKRVVQIENSYAPLRRKDRGRMRRDGRPIAQIYRYELPEEWAMLP